MLRQILIIINAEIYGKYIIFRPQALFGYPTYITCVHEKGPLSKHYTFFHIFCAFMLMSIWLFINTIPQLIMLNENTSFLNSKK